jgi:hypothetical protein
MEKSNSRLKNLTGFAGTRSDEGERTKDGGVS